MLPIKYLLILGNPLCPQKKCDPLTALALGSAVVGGIGNLLGQDSANKTSIGIAQQNREWQSEENQKARDYQTEMWNRQNEYNSPANQRRLLAEGGYNPFVMQPNGSVSGAGSAGVPSMQGAPNSPVVHPVNPLQGVSSVMDALNLSLQGSQVDQNVELQKSQMLLNLSKAAIDSYKEMGPKGFMSFMDKFAPYMKDLNFAGSPMRQQVVTELARLNIAKESEDLTLQLRERWDPQKAEREMEVLQNMPAKALAEIRKTNTSAVLDSAQAYRVGSEVARNLAEAGYFNQQSLQISTLLPFMKDQFILSLGSMGIDFLNKESDFSFEEYLRDYKHSDKAKAARKRTFGMDSSVNVVGAFMDGFVSKIPSGLINAGVNTRNIRTSVGSDFGSYYESYKYLPFGQ